MRACRFSVHLLSVLLLVGSPNATGNAVDGIFGAMQGLDEINSAGSDDQNPVLSPDGLTLFFASFGEVYQAKRARRGEPFLESQPLPLEINSNASDFPGCMSADGLTLYFFSNRRSGTNDYDILVARRETPEGDFLQAVELSEISTAEFHEGACTLTGDGNQMVFVSNRPGGTGQRDLWLAVREEDGAPFRVERSLSEINTAGSDRQPTISSDGLTLFWDVDGSTIWWARRPDLRSSFSDRRPLPEINQLGPVSTPWLSADWPAAGSELLYSVCPGSCDLQLAIWTEIPSAVASLGPREGNAPFELCADASASTTPEGTSIVARRWDFGDGVTAEGLRVCHTFERPGIFSATLTVENNVGLTHSVTETVKVHCPRQDLSPWTVTDVGEVQIQGGTYLAQPNFGCGNGLVFCAAGTRLTSAADTLLLVHQRASGAQRLEALVNTFEGGESTLAAAGLMFRQSSESLASYGGIYVRRTAGGHALRMSTRDAAGAVKHVNGPILSLPAHLRLELVDAPSGKECAGYLVGSEDTVIEVGRVPLPNLDNSFEAGAFATGGFSSQAAAFEAFHAELCGLTLSPTGDGPGCSHSVGPFLRGDCSGDGKTAGVGDAVFMLSANFLGGVEIPCKAACDTNGDGITSGVGDAILLLSANFLGGVTIPAPSPECGCSERDSDRTLGCERTPTACP